MEASLPLAALEIQGLLLGGVCADDVNRRESFFFDLQQCGDFLAYLSMWAVHRPFVEHRREKGRFMR